jgi:ferric-dicitrate binding protein FerR (iron transport regulator)
MKLSCNGHNPFLEQAALWVTVLQHEDTAEHRRAFASWLLQAPEHVEAFLVFVAAVEEAEERRATREQHNRLEVSHFGQASKLVKGFSTLCPGPQPSTTTTSPPPRRPMAIAASVAAASVGLLVLLFHSPQDYSHRSEVTPESIPMARQQPDAVIDSPRFVSLGPGSLLRVGKDSLVRVHAVADGGRHEVSVVEGTAYFSGLHEGAQSLIVHSGRIVIAVMGTDFLVKNEHGVTEIAVFTGEVRFTCQAEPEESTVTHGVTFLKRNAEALLASNDCAQPPKVIKLSSQAHVSAEPGWLVFDNTPLKEAAEMFNRANAHYLFVVDKAIAKERIGGNFRIFDLDGFLQALGGLGIRAKRGATTPDGVVIYLMPAAR